MNFQDSHGMTALHYMLRKVSDKRHFRTLLQDGARGDLKSKNGDTAVEIMSRKRDPDFKAMARALLTRRAPSLDRATCPRYDERRDNT